MLRFLHGRGQGITAYAGSKFWSEDRASTRGLCILLCIARGVASSRVVPPIFGILSGVGYEPYPTLTSVLSPHYK